MQFKTVSLQLLKPMDKLVIKFSVNLSNSKWGESYYNIYEQPNANYLTFTPDASIVFQYKDANTVYDPSHTVRITDETLFQVNKDFQEFYKNLLRPDLFTYYKSGAVVCHPRRDDKKTISLLSGGFMELNPGVIVDEKTNSSLPGVHLCLNIKENLVSLSMNEFEAILLKLSKIDISLMAIQLIQSSELMRDKVDKHKNVNIESKPRSTSAPNIFQKPVRQTSQDEIVDTRVSQINQPTSLDELILE